MGKWRVSFKYIADGYITLEADTFDKAEEMAATKLEELRELGDIHGASDDDYGITWTDDEVEL